MENVAVHAAVGKQADEVQRGAVFFCVIHGVYEENAQEFVIDNLNAIMNPTDD